MLQRGYAAADEQLLALVLARGSVIRRGRSKPKKSWTSVELAEDLFAAVGGKLANLVEGIARDTVDLSAYGVGQTVGARLVGTMELAVRWCRGFRGGGNKTIRFEGGINLFQMVFRRKAGRATDGELVALILGGSWPDPEKARSLLDAYDTIHELFHSFTFDLSQGVRRGKQQYIPVRGTGTELAFPAYCRLSAGIEIARRYRDQMGVGTGGFEIEALGLNSDNLVRLLDPSHPLDQDLRSHLVAVLRSHPELADDFLKLDRLAGDARTEDYRQAIECHQMFGPRQGGGGSRAPERRGALACRPESPL